MLNRQHRFLYVLCLLAALPLGCASSRSSYRPIAAAEPSLDGVAGNPAVVADVPAARPITFADRHPLFSKPREYYERVGDNKLARTAAATFIGVPAGIVGEMRQIVIGNPAPHY